MLERVITHVQCVNSLWTFNTREMKSPQGRKIKVRKGIVGAYKERLKM